MLKKIFTGLALVSVASFSSASAQTGNAGSPKDYYLTMKCPAGQGKILIQRGKNDNFATGNKEYFRTSGGVQRLQHFKQRPQTGYDATASDLHFLDHVDIPSTVTSGYIMLGMKAVSGNSNDNIQIGDLPSVYNTTDNTKRYAYVSRINELETNGWQVSGNTYSSDLSNLSMRDTGKTVLDLIQSGFGHRVVDIHVQDDTAVDYVVFGLCIQQ